MIPLPSFAGFDTGAPQAPAPIPAIVLVNGNKNAATSTSVLLPMPAAIAADDFGVISARGSNGAVTNPSTWTQLAANIFDKKLLGSETNASLAAASGDILGAVQAFRGVHASAPIDASSTLGTATGTTFAGTAITATHDNSMLVTTIRGAVPTGTPVITPPAGFTAIIQVYGTSFVGVACKYGYNTSVSSGTPSWTSSIAVNSAATVGFIFLRAA